MTIEEEEDNGWFMKVERIGNGFLVTSSDEAYPDAIVEDDKLHHDSGRMDADIGERLCWEVLNYFCLTGSKHDDYRISVKVKKVRDDNDGEEGE